MNGTLKQCQKFVKALFKSFPNHENVRYYERLNTSNTEKLKEGENGKTN